MTGKWMAQRGALFYDGGMTNPKSPERAADPAARRISRRWPVISGISALALALGLADVVESLSGKIRMDTIFIDEGFGSLDSENGAGTLDQVLQVLSALTKGNRAVGLISHVGLVQEAIPQGFYVRSTPSGSRVEERRGL